MVGRSICEAAPRQRCGHHQRAGRRVCVGTVAIDYSGGVSVAMDGPTWQCALAGDAEHHRLQPGFPSAGPGAARCSLALRWLFPRTVASLAHLAILQLAGDVTWMPAALLANPLQDVFCASNKPNIFT